MQSTTPRTVLLIVVCTVAGCTVFGVVSLSMVMYFKIEPSPIILQALITMTTNLGGVLTGMLINTRQPPKDGTTETLAIETTSEKDKP